MPATAGRVRMPANNRVHSSAALQTHGIWQSAIGYDPYAPTIKGSDKGSARPEENSATAASENAYASFQGLLALARATGSGSNDARGACKKCGRVGHLTFQCRNFLSTKDPSAADKEKDDASLQAAAAVAFEQIRKSNGIKDESSEEEEEEEEDEEENDSTDSDVDPEIENIIAARFGKKSKKSTDDKRAEDSKEDKVSHQHRGRSKKRSGRKRSKESNEADSDEEDDKRKKRRRQRGFDDDVDEDKHGHRHRRSRRDEYDDDSEDESDRRHQHHHKRRHYQRNDSESDSDDSDRTNSREKSCKHYNRHRKQRTTTSETGLENDGSENVRGRKGRK